jgi:cell division inhibitor SulA
MGAVVSLRAGGLDALLDARQVWRGQPPAAASSRQSTGFAALDAQLPGGGWPEASLSEVLLAHDGIGELQLLWPTLARLSREHAAAAGRVIVLIAPPYLPLAGAWAQAGVHLPALQVVQAPAREVSWATEQCLRSAACAAVLCWLPQADDRALRRLQLAADTGQCLAFAMRPLAAANQPSPAALRIAVEGRPAQLRVLKCRGGNPPTQPLAWPVPVAAANDRQAATLSNLPGRAHPERA